MTPSPCAHRTKTATTDGAVVITPGKEPAKLTLLIDAKYAAARARGDPRPRRAARSRGDGQPVLGQELRQREDPVLGSQQHV